MATCESGIHYPVDNPLCVHQPILVAGALTDEWFDLLIEVSLFIAIRLLRHCATILWMVTQEKWCVNGTA